MLDHVTIGVSNIERSKAFYDKALKAIGIERVYAGASPAPAQHVSRREARATQQSLKSAALRNFAHRRHFIR
jgi:catechol 2,3-dioxygenase-like lactoylglutathione lyase family enzyme